MAESEVPQFSDRSTPESLGDLNVQAPLLVAPPLGINRQFLVPLGARSLTVLEPDLFQPRSTHKNSSLFGDSPFFKDPLLTASSKPVVQPSSSVEGLSASGGALLQRSMTTPPTLNTQQPTDTLSPSHAPTPSIGIVNQSDKLVESAPFLQHSNKTRELQASEANRLADLPQDAPEQTTATRELGASSTSPEISSTTIEKIEDSSSHRSLSSKEWGDLPTLEATNASASFSGNAVQRSTTLEAASEPVFEAASESTIVSKSDSSIESEAKSISDSGAEQISKMQGELAFVSSSEQISELIDRLPFKAIPDVQPQAAFDVQSETIDRSGTNSAFEPVSAPGSSATTAPRSTEMVELTAKAKVEAASGLKSELAIASTEESSNSAGALKDQANGFSQPSVSKAASSPQYSQLSQPSTSTTSPIEPEIIARQLAPENPSIEIVEQSKSLLDSSVQRSQDADSLMLVPSNEVVQNPAERLEVQVDHSAIEPFTTQPLSSQLSHAQSLQASSITSVSNTTFDGSNAAIATQTSSLLSPLSSHVLQAKKLEPSPQPTIGSITPKQRSAPNAPSKRPLEQPKQLLEENLASAELELPTNLQTISESEPQTLQASLDPQLNASTDSIPLAPTTPVPKSNILQTAQVLPQSETISLIARSLNQPSTEAISIAHQAEHESLFEPIPSLNSPSSIQSDLQLRSTETIPEIASDLHHAEGTVSRAEAPELALKDQILANPEDREGFTNNTTVLAKAFNSASLESPSTAQNLNLAQVSFAEHNIISAELDAYSVSDPSSESSFIQAKDFTASESHLSAGRIAVPSEAYNKDSASVLDTNTSSLETPPTAQSSTPLLEEPKVFSHPSSHLDAQNPDIRNLALQDQNTQNLSTQSLEINHLETQGLQAKSSETQSPETQNLEAQKLELLSEPEIFFQSKALPVQSSIDTLTTELTETSDTIARTVDETNQSKHSAENTLNFVDTEPHSTQSTTAPTAANSNTVPNQDVAQISTNNSATVNLSTLSNQEVVQKQDELISPSQAIDSLTPATLQTTSDPSIVSAAQSFFLQQPEPQQTPSELETGQSLPASINSKGVLSSSHAATVQRSSETSIASSNGTTRHATFDTSDTSSSDTPSSGLTEPLSSRSTEPLPHTQDLPEVQALLDVQNPVQSAFDAAIVQAQTASQAPLSSSMEPTSSVASSVTSIDGTTDDGTTEVVIAQSSLLTPEANAHSPTVMRSVDLSLPELEAPSSPDVTPARPLELALQHQQSAQSDAALETIGNTPTSSLSFTAEVPIQRQVIPIQTNLTTDRCSNRSLSVPLEKGDAVGKASLQGIGKETSSVAFTHQNGITSLAEAASQPLTVDSLETQHSGSSASQRVTPSVDAASQPLAADSLEVQRRKSFTAPYVAPLAETTQSLAGHSLETQYSESFTAPQVTPLVDAAIQPLAADSLDTPHSESLTSPSETAEAGSHTARSPQITKPSLTQATQVDLLQPAHQHLSAPNSSPKNLPLHNLSLQDLEEPIASEVSSQTLPPPITPIETAHETAFPAIVQRMLTAGQAAEPNSSTVDHETSWTAAPINTKVDNPVDDLSKTVGSTAQPEATTALPLVLQSLSTLEPLTSSAHFFSHASATAPSVQASRQSTPQSNQTPALEQPQSKPIVKVDRPTTQWSDFSDLVQRQTTPSARSSNRSTTEQATALHSVAAVLATDEIVQRQPDQPETVRISRHDQSQSTAANQPNVVDAKALEQLAQVIYQQLRQRLRIEQERHGRDGAGRLPW